ncbi:hypothetical protein B7463_g1293, partial [Scytalidium lignicola]
MLVTQVLAQSYAEGNEYIPQYLTDSPLPQGHPWGGRTANNTDVYPPYTGVIRAYDFTIKREVKAPDGYQRRLILINGQFPGPLIEANWGDTIQVRVRNEIDDPPEGVALHWHGLLQKSSQWMDGVPGIQQCPIPPGKTFTYTFRADLYGTSWYHSHYSAQYADGIYGPMIIHGPDTVPYDIDKGPILLTDYFHTQYWDLVADAVGTDIHSAVPYSDNNLINGKNNFNCASVSPGDRTPCKNNSGIPNFRFSPGKVHRLRLINAGTEAIQKFSIDGHNMTVIANDFVPIQPYETQVVTLGVGQRTDVLVTGLSHESGAYMMRSSVATCSSCKSPNATAIIYYHHDDLSRPVTTTPWPSWVESVAHNCANDYLNKTVPWYPMQPDLTPSVTETINIAYGQNETGHWLWTMNNSSFRADYNAPILLLSNLGNNSYPDNPEWNVYNFGSNSSIHVGQGTWTNSTIINPTNPQRRDVQIMPGAGYLVLQITADNPGVWPLHCHIAWHVSGGLYISVMERPDDIAKLQIPSIMAQTCRDWAAFSGHTVIDQIDSGL